MDLVVVILFTFCGIAGVIILLSLIALFFYFLIYPQSVGNCCECIATQTAKCCSCMFDSSLDCCKSLFESIGNCCQCFSTQTAECCSCMFDSSLDCCKCISTKAVKSCTCLFGAIVFSSQCFCGNIYNCLFYFPIKRKEKYDHFYNTEYKDWNKDDVQIFLDIIGLGEVKDLLKCMNGKTLNDLKLKKDRLKESINALGVMNADYINSFKIGLDWISNISREFLSVTAVMIMVQTLNLKEINPNVITNKCLHQRSVMGMSINELSQVFFGKGINTLTVLQKYRLETFVNVFYSQIFCDKPISQIKFLSNKDMIKVLVDCGLGKYSKTFEDERINGLFLSILKNRNNMNDLSEFLREMGIENDHYESFLSLLFNIQLFKKDDDIYQREIPSLNAIINEYKNIGFSPILTKNGVDIIQKYAIHGGLYSFLNVNNIPKNLGDGDIMKSRLKQSSEDFHNKCPDIINIHNVYCNLTTDSSNAPENKKSPPDFNLSEGLSTNDSDIFEMICRICFDNPATKTMLACDHEFCNDCFKSLKERCPYCKGQKKQETNANNHDIFSSIKTDNDTIIVKYPMTD